MSVHAPHDEHDHKPDKHGYEHDHSQPKPPTHSHAGDACCGSHSRAATQPSVASAPISKPVVVADGVKTPIRILQMDCPTEEGLLRKKLGGMAGVTGLEFNLMQRVLTVTHAPQAIEPILAAVRSLGFTPEIADGASA